MASGLYALEKTKDKEAWQSFKTKQHLGPKKIRYEGDKTVAGDAMIIQEYEDEAVEDMYEKTKRSQ